jgi:N utilization substance protein B
MRSDPPSPSIFQTPRAGILLEKERKVREHLRQRFFFSPYSLPLSSSPSMNRRRAREYALRALFQREFTGDKQGLLPNESPPAAVAEKKEAEKFADALVQGTIDNLEQIDRAIMEAAEHWEMERMAAVDRNILRFAVYEILFRKDIPSAVTINEALEIAKKYSSLESVPFINGLLDKIARDVAKK